MKYWLDSESAAHVEQGIWCPKGRAGSNPAPGVFVFFKKRSSIAAILW